MTDLRYYGLDDLERLDEIEMAARKKRINRCAFNVVFGTLYVALFGAIFWGMANSNKLVNLMYAPLGQ